MARTYRVPLLWFISGYAFSLVVIVFMWVYMPITEMPWCVRLIMVFLCGGILLGPLTLVGRSLCLDDRGISQGAIGFRWQIAWENVADWSAVAVHVYDGGPKWEAHVFIKGKSGEIFDVHPWFLSQQNLTELKADLMNRAGPPKSAVQPVLHPRYSRCEWKWI